MREALQKNGRPREDRGSTPDGSARSQAAAPQGAAAGRKKTLKDNIPPNREKVNNLTPDELERFTELAAKYENDAGMNRADAEARALSDILAARKPKGPRFVKIGGAAIKPIQWLIRGFLETGSLAMIFGDSGTLKTFLIIAACCCIATGRAFFGMKVQHPGAVYYVAAEGQHGLIRRFHAWSQENLPILDAPIYRFDGIVNLSIAADILLKALEAVIAEEKAPPVLVVIDTWARSLGSDDCDTTAAAEGLGKLDFIRSKFPEICILVVHHTGHANKERARGASLLHAAVDSEYRLEKDKSGNIILTNTKSKESELLPPMAFRPRRVNLIGEDGNFISGDDFEIETSVVLEKVEYTAPSGEIGGLGKNQERILASVTAASGSRIEADHLLEILKGRFNLKKDAFDKSVLSLVERDLLKLDGAFICLTGAGNV